MWIVVFTSHHEFQVWLKSKRNFPKRKHPCNVDQLQILWGDPVEISHVKKSSGDRNHRPFAEHRWDLDRLSLWSHSCSSDSRFYGKSILSVMFHRSRLVCPHFQFAVRDDGFQHQNCRNQSQSMNWLRCCFDRWTAPESVWLFFSLDSLQFVCETNIRLFYCLWSVSKAFEASHTSSRI